MQRFSYAKVVTDDDGESRFEDVEVTMEEAQFAPPAPPLNLAALGSAEAVALMGGDADWGATFRTRRPQGRSSASSKAAAR